MPEYLLAIIGSSLLGWGSFTWRRAERAVELALKAQDAADRIELKLAESYLTKSEFNTQMDRLMIGIERLEMKIDSMTLNVNLNHLDPYKHHNRSRQKRQKPYDCEESV